MAAIGARLRAGIRDDDVAERAQTSPPARSSPLARGRSRAGLSEEMIRERASSFVGSVHSFAPTFESGPEGKGGSLGIGTVGPSTSGAAILAPCLKS